MINILLNNDYPLKGNLNYFEAYMFATTERHIAKHYIMKGNIHLFDGSKDEEKFYSMDELETRKKALKEFNSSNKEDFEDNFSPDHYSIVLIDFDDEDDNYNIDEVDEISKLILSEYSKFLKENKRKGALVPHFFQHDRIPHLHLIYQKQESNEFVNYLYKVFGVEE